ncbi:substrate-binding domain-containing protein [Epidermidibacterium keratini]|nr:substrate-binding domain-containing protein [Epidermidibacterium keratini]
MRTQRTGCISLVIADITNPLFGQIVRSVERALAERGLTLVLWDEDARDTNAMEDVRLSLVDGIIMAAALPGSRVLDAALRNRVPMVLINRTLDDLEADAVLSEDYRGGFLAAQYLVACGRKRIGALSGPDGATNSRDRARGFRDGLAASGTGLPPTLDRTGEITHEAGRQALHAMVRDDPDLDAVFCISDLIALGVVDGAKELGRDVPADLFVMGYNDIDMASWASYSLSTFSHPIDQMASEALNLLTRRIAHPNSRATVVRLPNRLIIRDSTNQVPFPGPMSTDELPDLEGE